VVREQCRRGEANRAAAGDHDRNVARFGRRQGGFAAAACHRCARMALTFASGRLRKP
jgi:hypothetical protein